MGDNPYKGMPPEERSETFAAIYPFLRAGEFTFKSKKDEKLDSYCDLGILELVSEDNELAEYSFTQDALREASVLFETLDSIMRNERKTTVSQALNAFVTHVKWDNPGVRHSEYNPTIGDVLLLCYEAAEKGYLLVSRIGDAGYKNAQRTFIDREIILPDVRIG